MYADVRGGGVERRVAGGGDGRRGSRHGRALPVARAVRARARQRRADRRRRPRAGVRHRHRPGVQRLDEGLLRRRAGRACSARAWSRRTTSTARSPRRAAAWRSSGSRPIFLAPATVNRRPWHHPAYDPLWAEIERLDVPIAFHGGGQTYLKPDFSLEVLDKLMLWHTFSQPLGHPVRHRVLLRWRRARAVPRPAGRAARGQLLVGAVVPLPARRALRVDRLVRGARPHDEAVRLLPAQLLDLGRGRRGHGAALHRHASATTGWSSRPTTRTATRSSRTRSTRSTSCR